MSSNDQAERYLRTIEKKLINKAKEKPELSHHWANRYPKKPGVYVAFEHGILVYVGETGNVRGRMKDLLDSRRHSLRRNIGKYNFSGRKGYRDATSREKFPQPFETHVESWIERKISISVLAVSLGRKELEERIYKKHGPKYNKRGLRKTG